MTTPSGSGQRSRTVFEESLNLVLSIHKTSQRLPQEVVELDFVYGDKVHIVVAVFVPGHNRDQCARCNCRVNGSLQALGRRPKLVQLSCFSCYRWRYLKCDLRPNADGAAAQFVNVNIVGVFVHPYIIVAFSKRLNVRKQLQTEAPRAVEGGASLVALGRPMLESGNSYRDENANQAANGLKPSWPIYPGRVSGAVVDAIHAISPVRWGQA